MENFASRRLDYAPLVICLGAFIFCYFGTFQWLHYKYSQEDSYYSHGYLIPLVSLYVVYMKFGELRAIKIAGCKIGLPILICALVIHFVGVAGDINFVSGFSILVYIAGCSLYLFGKDIFRELRFPILFLVFMFPIPDAFINYLGLPTKQLSTGLGLRIVDLMSIPYLQEGFRITLSNTCLVVGSPCNGMKSLIALGAVGALFVYFADVKIWTTLLILGGIYPLAVLLNGIRIALLVLIAARLGIEKAAPSSYMHDLSGLTVFAFGVVILLVIVRISGRANRR